MDSKYLPVDVMSSETGTSINSVPREMATMTGALGSMSYLERLSRMSIVNENEASTSYGTITTTNTASYDNAYQPAVIAPPPRKGMGSYLDSLAP